MLELVKLLVLLWIAFWLTVFGVLLAAQIVSERKRQRVKRDEFLWLMEHQGFPDMETAERCMGMISEGDYHGAVKAMRRKLRDSDFRS